MTEEKIEEFKDIMQRLYEIEGRSFSYIGRLLGIDRQRVSSKIKEWGFTPAHVPRLTPSAQKFARRHRQFIISRFRDDVPETKIAKELGVTRDYLRNIVNKTECLKVARDEYVKRLHERHVEKVAALKEKSRLEYDPVDLDGEIWKSVLGHEEYSVSNMGRVKRCAVRYDSYFLLKQERNPRNGRMYVRLGGRNLQVARLVGFAFIDGHSAERNTIDHKNGNTDDNRAVNLEWVTQSENNLRAYRRGRKKNRAYERRSRSDMYVVDGKYEFKTIEALSRFLNVSWTQTARYINGECACARSIEVKNRL